jgi:uncharacterized protein (UPF0332 family)
MLVPMEFDEKARENLEAVDRLLPDEEGTRDCLANAVANRAYYAAYHAVAHVAQARRLAFTSGRGYYQHDTLPDEARQHGILSDEGRNDLKELFGMRVKADYEEEPVDIEEAERVASLARKLVKEVLE